MKSISDRPKKSPKQTLKALPRRSIRIPKITPAITNAMIPHKSQKSQRTNLNSLILFPYISNGPKKKRVTGAKRASRRLGIHFSFTV